MKISTTIIIITILSTLAISGEKLPQENKRDLKRFSWLAGAGFILWGGFDGYQRFTAVADYERAVNDCEDISSEYGISDSHCDPGLGTTFFIGFAVDFSLMFIGANLFD